MAKKNDDFFEEKKLWSHVKDELLGCYLKPYVAKILHTNRPIAYVDCFAGKGKFDDGNPGSPIIALDIFKQCLESCKSPSKKPIDATFVDIFYADDLEQNLSDYSGVEIISDAYENVIDKLLKSKIGCNVFLYIDPYGIKALDCSKFDAFAKGEFHTVELLINMNSFGFIREACHAMGAEFKTEDSELFDDLVEYDTTKLDNTKKSVETLNKIAGGDYWKKIIRQYKNGSISGYRAEEEFAKQYCNRLGKSYRYVLNMPIRIKKNQHPKYRMIHATNHPAGCVLMAENICNRWELMKSLQDSGQITFFQTDINNQIIDPEKIRNHVIEHFSQYDEWISLTEAQAAFYVKNGVICKSGKIVDELRHLEREKKIEVKRNPVQTKTGKPSTFMTESHRHKVSVRWVKL